MFAAIYRWNVHPGCEEEFSHAWVELTRLIRQFLGSLGSRLHRADDGSFVAYAQWPSRSAWEQSDTITSTDFERWRKIMRQSADRIYPDVLMEVINDEFVG
jgi:quinol monooxygenase YgiN